MFARPCALSASGPGAGVTAPCPRRRAAGRRPRRPRSRPLPSSGLASRSGDWDIWVSRRAHLELDICRHLDLPICRRLAPRRHSMPQPTNWHCRLDQSPGCAARWGVGVGLVPPAPRLFSDFGARPRSGPARVGRSRVGRSQLSRARARARAGGRAGTCEL
eukprot:2138195-Prymnesium_polylepis.1